VVQVDPIKPKLELIGAERLKLKCDELLSNFAFKIKLRRYTLAGVAFLANAEACGLGGGVAALARAGGGGGRDGGRGLHSSTFRLNVSAFCG